MDETESQMGPTTGGGVIAPDPLPEHRGAVDARWAGVRLLWLHALALGVVLLALVPVVHNGYIAVPDEGVYSAEAQNLANGSWSSARPAPDVDPDGRLSGITPSAVLGDREVPHARNPLYPVILWPAYAAAGSVGLLLTSVLGVWTAAVATAFLARRLRRPYGVPALWLTGLGSPLIFSAFVVVGHALTAAACAVLLLSVAAVLDDRRLRWLPAALLAAAALAALRSEGVIVVAAVGGVIGLLALPRPGRRLDLRAGAVGASVLAAGGAAFLLSVQWSNAIAAGADASESAGAVPTDRNPATAAWIALGRPWESGLNAEASVLLMVLCLLLAAVLLRLLPRWRVLSLGLLLIAGLAGLVLLVRPPNLVTGLVPAFPVLVAVIFLRRDDLRRPLVQRLVGVVAIGTVGILATIYSDGGSTQWGGRFFHVLLPALVPLVVVGLDRARARCTSGEAVVAGVCLVVVALSLSVTALRANVAYREHFELLVGATEQALAEGPDAGQQLVIYGPLATDGLSRGFWDERTTMDVLSPGDPRLIFPVVASASEAGIQRVLVLTTTDAGTLELFERGVLERIEWEITDDRTIDSTWHLVELQPIGTSG